MNPGIYILGDTAISGAMSGIIITRGTSSGGIQQEFIGGLDGMDGVTLQCNFAYGGGGTTAKVDIETSLDQGLTWITIARFAFTNVTAERIMNVNAATSRLTPYTPVVPTDDTAIDGILGDRLRAKLTTTGVYTGATTLSVRAHVR
jgi:hypothetical protein